MVFEIDGSGVATYVNPAIEKFLGYTVEDAVGRHIKDYVLEADLPKLAQNLPKVLSGTPSANEYRLLTKSGDIRWVSTSSYPLIEGGRVIAVRVVLKDITDLKLSDERHRAFVANSHDAIWCVEFSAPIAVDLPEEEILDLIVKCGFVTEANDAYARMNGFERVGDVTGLPLTDLLPRSNG